LPIKVYPFNPDDLNGWTYPKPALPPPPDEPPLKPPLDPPLKPPPDDQPPPPDRLPPPVLAGGGVLLKTFDVLFSIRVSPADIPASPPVKLPETSLSEGIPPPAAPPPAPAGRGLPKPPPVE